MLSVLVRALPKALQQHVQLQMTETSSYDQVRTHGDLLRGAPLQAGV